MTKTWVMVDVVPETSKDYLTEGKWYEVDVEDSDGGNIIVDDNIQTYTLFKGSNHINLRNWNVHHGDTPPNNHLESSILGLESSTNDFKGIGDTEVAGEVENVSNQFLWSLTYMRDGMEIYDLKDSEVCNLISDLIYGLDSGKYTILYNKDLTK